MIHSTASIALITRDDRFLFGLRTDIPFWGLPGGSINGNETYEEGVIREVYEETGLVVDVTKLVGSYLVPVPHWEKVKDAIEMVFLCRVVGGELTITDGEHTEFSWFTLPNIPLNVFPWQVQYTKDVLMEGVFRDLRHLGGGAW